MNIPDFEMIAWPAFRRLSRHFSVDRFGWAL
jgi:hypothetical protein